MKISSVVKLDHDERFKALEQFDLNQPGEKSETGLNGLACENELVFEMLSFLMARFPCEPDVDDRRLTHFGTSLFSHLSLEDSVDSYLHFLSQPFRSTTDSTRLGQLRLVRSSEVMTAWQLDGGNEHVSEIAVEAEENWNRLCEYFLGVVGSRLENQNASFFLQRARSPDGNERQMGYSDALEYVSIALEDFRKKHISLVAKEKPPLRWLALCTIETWLLKLAQMRMRDEIRKQKSMRRVADAREKDKTLNQDRVDFDSRARLPKEGFLGEVVEPTSGLFEGMSFPAFLTAFLYHWAGLSQSEIALHRNTSRAAVSISLDNSWGRLCEVLSRERQGEQVGSQ